MYYYIQTEPGLFTVGHGDGETWSADSDHDSREEAAKRVRYLNGGKVEEEERPFEKAIRQEIEKDQVVDGGSAFPGYGQEGMSLRQWYAGQALTGLVANEYGAEKCAEWAVNIADALIEKLNESYQS